MSSHNTEFLNKYFTIHNVNCIWNKCNSKCTFEVLSTYLLRLKRRWLFRHPLFFCHLFCHACPGVFNTVRMDTIQEYLISDVNRKQCRLFLGDSVLQMLTAWLDRCYMLKEFRKDTVRLVLSKTLPVYVWHEYLQRKCWQSSIITGHIISFIM